jgi:hypothetical protein
MAFSTYLKQLGRFLILGVHYNNIDIVINQVVNFKFSYNVFYNVVMPTSTCCILAIILGVFFFQN